MTSTIGRSQPPFGLSEIALIAASALIAPFPLVYFLGASMGTELDWAWPTVADLVHPDRIIVLSLIAPLMVAIVWLYDRIDSWWTTHTAHAVHNIPHFAFGALLTASVFFANKNAAPLACWLIAVWVVSLFSRPIVRAFRSPPG